MKLRVELENSQIILVGTAHILKESVESVSETILEEKPDYVAIELDPNRFRALELGERRKPRFRDFLSLGFGIALLGFLLSYLQEKVGENTGVLPGEEMLKAVECAREVGAEIVFIDRDVMITLKKLLKEIPLREKLKILKEMLFQDSMQELEIPNEDFVERIVSEFKEITPTGYRILISERDEIMAESLLRMKGKVVCVVGAGHLLGIKRFLEEGVAFERA
ncbi:MAG: TraB family protein [Candidatus Methanofastidiosia archaeon]